MESIGIWHKKQNEDSSPFVSFHINLWNIRDKKKKSNPFIDFGISIKGYKKVDNFTILFPFLFYECEVIDLYNSVKNAEVARLIFNEVGCEIESVDEYSIIKIDGMDSQLLLPMKNNDQFREIVQKQTIDQKYDILKFDFTKIKKDERLQKLDNVYIRFRIKCKGIKDALFCPVDKPNWFLESGFVKTQIVDIKINRERNLPHDYCKERRLNNDVFSQLEKIHLLIMCNSNDNVESISNFHSDCRKLEENGWNAYLGNDYDTSNILAYHWKEKDEKNGIKDYSRLIRITSASTNIVIIGIYIISVVMLGALGNLLFDIIKNIF